MIKYKYTIIIVPTNKTESLLNQWLWLIAGKEKKVKMAKEKHKEIEKLK